jgi:hypothetical protein
MQKEGLEKQSRVVCVEQPISQVYVRICFES